MWVTYGLSLKIQHPQGIQQLPSTERPKLSEVRDWVAVCTQMFTVVWFTVSGKCQQSNCPSVAEWINSMVYPYYGLLKTSESVKSLTPVQLFDTPLDCSPPGSSVHGILQARILEWVAMPSSKGSSSPRDRTWVTCISCLAGRLLYLLSHQGNPNSAFKRKISWHRLQREWTLRTGCYMIKNQIEREILHDSLHVGHRELVLWDTESWY